jgi:hypothetical protein
LAPAVRHHSGGFCRLGTLGALAVCRNSSSLL